MVAVFRYTKIGLMVRATVQNRAMAQTLGVNTRRVDMFCFAFGAGLAGLAGFGVYLIGNTTPQMGQGYIVDSFLVVVVGVGKLLGVVISGLGIGSSRRSSSRSCCLTSRSGCSTRRGEGRAPGGAIYPTRRGLVPRRGGRNQATGKDDMPWLGRPTWRTDAVLGGLLVVVGLIVIPGLYLSGHMGLDTLNRYGYFICFAICAVGLDLIWATWACCPLPVRLARLYAWASPSTRAQKDVNGIPECLAYVIRCQSPTALPGLLPEPGHVVPLGHDPPAGGGNHRRDDVPQPGQGVYFAILTQAITVIAPGLRKNDLKMGGPTASASPSAKSSWPPDRVPGGSTRSQTGSSCTSCRSSRQS